MLNFEKGKVLQKDRFAQLLEVIRQEPGQRFEIEYLFYDQSEFLPEICMGPDYPQELRELVTRSVILSESF
jgi:hypothetical protein